MLILLNKPFGVICQFSPSGDRPTLADLVRVPGVGHMPSWEAPSVVVDAIEQVLAEASAPPASVGSSP